jgi:signal transduction histidine kinase
VADGGALTGGGELNESRDMLRVLCHEFRTPVASVQALARALAGDTAPLSTAQRVEAARLIADHAAHLAAMLEAVGTVAEHLPTATARSRPSMVRLADVVAGAADAAGLTALELHIAPPVETVVVDVPSVRRILTNVLENARRHGREPIVVRIERRGGHLWITAADHGPGMSSDVAARALRGGPPPTEGAHGLGLWIVTQLVAMLGGSVRACANRPTGTRVEITLPLPG